METFLDAIYFEKPVFLLIPLVLLLLQVLSGILRAPVYLTAISAIGHAVGIALIMINGGTLSDVLVLVLITGLTALAFCPKPAVPAVPKKKAAPAEKGADK